MAEWFAKKDVILANLENIEDKREKLIFTFYYSKR